MQSKNRHLVHKIVLLILAGLVFWIAIGSYIYRHVVDEVLLNTIAYNNDAHNQLLSNVERALRLGANPNITNEYGVTPLMIAIVAGRPHIIEVLLRYGADPNWPTEAGNALLWARVKAASDPAVKPTVPRMIAMLKAAGAKEWVQRPSSKREANSEH